MRYRLCHGQYECVGAGHQHLYGVDYCRHVHDHGYRGQRWDERFGGHHPDVISPGQRSLLAGATFQGVFAKPLMVCRVEEFHQIKDGPAGTAECFQCG